MLLKTSISNTKKFFQKTLQTFKSFLSRPYQRLPKSPPFNPFSFSPAININFAQSYNQELDEFYSDFTDRWDNNEEDKGKKRRHKEKISSSKNEKQVYVGSLATNFTKSNSKKSCEVVVETREDQEKKRPVLDEGKRNEDFTPCSSKIGVRKGRTRLVAQKLKELEMMDRSNIEHVLDIEEVLHYYSRLTCPAYVDIVDKFFMEMYSELSNLPQVSNSILRVGSVKGCQPFMSRSESNEE